MKLIKQATIQIRITGSHVDRACAGFTTPFCTHTTRTHTPHTCTHTCTHLHQYNMCCVMCIAHINMPASCALALCIAIHCGVNNGSGRHGPACHACFCMTILSSLIYVWLGETPFPSFPVACMKVDLLLRGGSGVCVAGLLLHALPSLALSPSLIIRIAVEEGRRKEKAGLPARARRALPCHGSFSLHWLWGDIPSGGTALQAWPGGSSKIIEPKGHPTFPCLPISLSSLYLKAL